MDWATIQPVLQLMAETEMGIPCLWEDQNQPRPAHPFATLAVTSVQKLGVDDVKRVYNATNDEMDVEVQGQRGFRLRVQVYTDSQQPTGSAVFYLDKMRGGVAKPSNKTIFKTTNIAFKTADDAQNIGRLIQGASESRWLMNLQFAGSVSFTDSAESYINTVELTGEVSGITVEQTITGT